MHYNDWIVIYLLKVVKYTSVDYDSIDIDDILDVHKNLKIWYKIIFEFIKKIFTGLLSICICTIVTSHQS